MFKLYARDVEPLIRFIQTAPIYRQGGAVALFFSATPFDACLMELPRAAGFFKDDQVDYALHRGDMTSLAKRVVDAVSDRNSEILSRHAEWRKRQERHDAYVRRIQEIDLAALDRASLIRELLDYQALVFYMWQGAYIIDCFDPDGHILLEQTVFARHPDCVGEDRERLLQHQELTTSLLLEQAILRRVVQNDTHIAEYIQKEFHWMENDYVHAAELPVEYFASRLSAILKECPTIEAQQKRLDVIDVWREHVMQEKEALFAQYHFTPREQGIVIAFSDLIDWREERKRKTQLSDWVYQQFIEALSHQLAIPIELLRYHDPRDTELMESPDFRVRLEQRKQHGVLHSYDAKTDTTTLIDDPGAIERFVIANAKRRASIDSAIRGQIAMKGHVRGRVCIVNSTKDFEKFQNDDVLVSIMTRPELMPVIRKAAGIITDEGGITCHAALIARELKIPCVIGTQQATYALHDGDQVELDANSGTVVKL